MRSAMEISNCDPVQSDPKCVGVHPLRAIMLWIHLSSSLTPKPAPGGRNTPRGKLLWTFWTLSFINPMSTGVGGIKYVLVKWMEARQTGIVFYIVGFQLFAIYTQGNRWSMVPMLPLATNDLNDLMENVWFIACCAFQDLGRWSHLQLLRISSGFPCDFVMAMLRDLDLLHLRMAHMFLFNEALPFCPSPPLGGGGGKMAKLVSTVTSLFCSFKKKFSEAISEHIRGWNLESVRNLVLTSYMSCEKESPQYCHEELGDPQARQLETCFRGLLFGFEIYFLKDFHSFVPLHWRKRCHTKGGSCKGRSRTCRAFRACRDWRLAKVCPSKMVFTKAPHVSCISDAQYIIIT